MKKTTWITQFCLGLLVMFSLHVTACKEISVNDDDLNRIEDIFGDDSTADASDDSESDAGEDVDSTADDGELSGDPDDASGGIEYWSASEKGQNRAFIGTYEKKYNYDDCSDNYWGPGLEMPAVLRAYAHGDSIDFETSLSQLVWSAIIYSDNTFDFQTRFLDSLNYPSVTLTCTCAINDDYWNNEWIDCSCDASNNTELCTLRYDLM